jgi:hypothetical protein
MSANLRQGGGFGNREIASQRRPQASTFGLLTAAFRFGFVLNNSNWGSLKKS